MATNTDMLLELNEVSLLILILSFLPFKEAVRTCILSKQWKDIWKQTMSIEFNELFFVKHGQQYDDETRQLQRNTFLNFIKSFMENFQGKDVIKFFLKVSTPGNIRDTVESCVTFATKHEVKELGLDFSDPNWDEITSDENYDALFELPNHVYENRSIKTLKLYSCSFVLHGLLNFEAIKEVSLGWIEVRFHTLRTLLSTCNTIENLSLKKCWNLEHFDMMLYGVKLGLRRLVIDKCDLDHNYFTFKAPNLKFFKYSGVVGSFEMEVNKHVMEEAEIDFALMPNFDVFGNQLYKLLEDLYPVRVLTVDSFLLQVIPSGDEPVRIQGDLNVRHLIIKTQMHHHEWCGFRFLLNSCPTLEKLTLEIDPQIILPDYEAPFHVDFKKFWHGPLIVQKCLKNTLKEVEVNRFRGTRGEFTILQYHSSRESVAKDEYQHSKE
ncbi:hypothetical protein RIF29_20576 [Crotalaria pallida]|uniref:F-box domain-containing protein n=1 Tax=Crotalaria pallida TaxID=3830 RepID=A0AAN9I8T4_CROPI